MNSVPQYLVVGHVTKDLLPDATYRTGGTAAYSALAAARLGLTVGVLTSANGDAPLLADETAISVQRRPAAHSTIFENIYIGKHRRQYVRALAETLTPADLRPGWGASPIVHLGPVCQEVAPDLVDAFPQALLGVTPQGFMRQWDASGLVTPLPWPDAARVLARADVVILSLQDVGGDLALLERIIQRARLLVLTLGPDGAIVHHAGQRVRVSAYEAEELDPTGAGDAFATGFLIRYYETRDPLEAARFANCVASFCVEGLGTSSLATRAQVEWRLQHGRLRT